MRVFVTSSCGWTARAIVVAVADAGHAVYGVDLSIRGPASLDRLAEDRPGVRHRTHMPELVGVLHRADRLDPPV